MKPLPLMVAAAALLVVTLDFFLNTSEMLAEARELRTSLAGALAADRERLARVGRVPGGEILEQLASVAREAEAVRGEARLRFFSGALAPTDYLVPQRQRPLGEDLSRARELLEQELLTLGVEIHPHPALRADTLGLRFLSSSVPMSSDPAVLTDQSERATVARFLLDQLRSRPGVELDGLSLRREADGRLLVDLSARGGLSDLVGFFESLVAPDPSIAPREVSSYTWRRLEPRDWGPSVSPFGSPPLKLDLKLVLWSPEQGPSSPALDEGAEVE